MAIPGIETITDFYQALEPRNKMMAKVGGIVGIVMIIVLLTDEPAERKKADDVMPDISGVFSVEDSDVTMQGLATQVANLQEKLNLTTQQNATQSATINRLNDTLQSLSNSDTNLKNLYELSRKQQLLESKIAQLTKEIEAQPTRTVLPSVMSVGEQLKADENGNLYLGETGQTNQPDISAEDLMFQRPSGNQSDKAPLSNLPKPNLHKDTSTQEFTGYNGDPVNDTPNKFPRDPSYDFLLKSNQGQHTEFDGAGADDEENEFIRNGETTVTKSRVVTAISHEKDQSPSATRSKKQDSYYVPKRLLPGALTPAVLMTGVDAPTGSQSSENVVSATFRITGPTIMPNGKRVDLTGCYVTAQVKGSLANERAFFRPDLITCDFSLGQIKTSLKGYVTSPIDGSVGIRGRLVSRAGDLLWNATLVGAIQGLSNAFGGNRSTNNSNIFAGGEPFSLPDTDVAAKAATTSAMSGAAEVLQQYFQDQLDAIYSIIEVRPLIPASIHLLDELTLKLMEPVKPQKLVDPLEAIQNEANASNQNNRRSNANLERPAT